MVDATAGAMAPEAIDQDVSTLGDHILAAARRVAALDGIAGLKRKAIAGEAGVKEAMVGPIEPWLEAPLATLPGERHVGRGLARGGLERKFRALNCINY